MWHSYFCEQRPNNEIILKVMSTGFLYKNEDVSSSRMMRHFSAFRPRGASVFHLQLTSPDKAALLGTWSGDMMLLWWQVCTLALTLSYRDLCCGRRRDGVFYWGPNDAGRIFPQSEPSDGAQTDEQLEKHCC